MLEAVANKVKGRVPWHNDGPTPELNSMAVIIDWLMTDGTIAVGKSGTKKMVLQKWASPNNSVKSSKTKGSL